MQDRCAQWASKGECSLNPNFMLRSCKKSCGQCSPSGAAVCSSRLCTLDLIFHRRLPLAHLCVSLTHDAQTSDICSSS